MASRKKHPVVYAFIDSQNLNLGTKKDIYKNRKRIYRGWPLDFGKFRKYLTNKFKVEKAFLFIGYTSKNTGLYNNLKKQGYELIFKPTVKDASGKLKGNVDAELVLHASAVQYKNYDKVVIVSGDGDYRCLCEFLEDNKKLEALVIPNSISESVLLKKFQKYKVFIQYERNKVEKL